MNSLIAKYFPDVDTETVSRLAELEPLYRLWNSRINVISRKDMDSFVLHHLLHSMAISKIISFKPGTRVLDAGTGGGFPGVPLAILFPEVEFVLADSIRKKIKVVSEVISDLNLSNVKPVWGRVEEIKAKFDFVVSRAVTAFPIFVPWINDKILTHSFNDLQNGILYLKGGDLGEELKDFPDSMVYNLAEHFSEAFFSEKKLVYMPMPSVH